MTVRRTTMTTDWEKVEFITKDSGDRTQYSSGMVRDRNDDKTRYDLLIPKDGVAMLDRWAELLTRGAEKYAARNWEKANSRGEMDEFLQSAWRHFRKWVRGDQDEDHAASVFFNIQGYEYVRGKLSWSEKQKIGDPIGEIRLTD
jgi:hypothetical protein